MEKIIGYYWLGEDENPIIKNGNKYYVINAKTNSINELKREEFQHGMTNPWDKLIYNVEKIDSDEYEASYLSIIYDSIHIRIVGVGESESDATCNMIENILDVMNGYDEQHVNDFINNLK